MVKKTLKRVNVSNEINDQIKKISKDRGITHDQIINEALQYFFKYSDEDHQKEDIYTQRMNEMTQALKNLSYNMGVANNSVLNRLDTLIEYNQSTTYLQE